jgi:hypothetical protein
MELRPSSESINHSGSINFPSFMWHKNSSVTNNLKQVSSAHILIFCFVCTAYVFQVVIPCTSASPPMQYVFRIIFYALCAPSPFNIPGIYKANNFMWEAYSNYETLHYGGLSSQRDISL